MGWSSTYGVKTRKEVIEEYTKNYIRSGFEVLKIADNGNWWLLKTPTDPDKVENEKERDVVFAMRMLMEKDGRNEDMMVKTILLEGGPDLTRFPKSWIPLLDLTNNERYRYNQLENLMKGEEHYIPKTGEAIMDQDGNIMTFCFKVKGAKYKYYYSDGYRRNQNTVDYCRERFLKRCVPVVV